MNQASTLPSIGDRVDGKFRIERKLGEGGTSTVYAVRHTITDKQFAIKWLSPELAKNELAVERFVHEAKICGRYAHANAVEIYDICRTQESIYLLMELLEGESLESRLKRVERFSVREACDILLPCIDALGAAHELGIVHRDLKPSNIFLCSVDGRAGEVPKVLDFGISKLSRNGHDMSPVTTTTRTVIGTPHYMAPEQMRGHPADPRFDVYALGVVLYELVAGRPPFQSDTFADLVFRILEAQSLRLDHVAQAEPEFADIVARAMARDAWDRFPSMAELSRALRPYGSQLASAFESPSSPGYEVTSTGVRRSLSADGAEAPPEAARGPASVDELALSTMSGSSAAHGGVLPSAPGDAHDRPIAPREARAPSVVSRDPRRPGAGEALSPTVVRRAAPAPADAPRDVRGVPVAPRDVRRAPVARDVRGAPVARDVRGAPVAPLHAQLPAAARASMAPAAASAQGGPAPASAAAAAPSALGAKLARSELEVREVTETSRVVDSSAANAADSPPISGAALSHARSKHVIALAIVLGAIALGLIWREGSHASRDVNSSKPVMMEPLVLRASTRAPSLSAPAEPPSPNALAAPIEPKAQAAADPVAKRSPARSTASARRSTRVESAKQVALAPEVSAALPAPAAETKPRIERQDFEHAQRGLTLPSTELSRQDF